jgi:hypothetical protein
LGRVLDEADRFGLPRPSVTLFRSHLNEIKELSEKLAGIMDADVLNPTRLREVLIEGMRSGVSLELQARAKEMGERHIAVDHQLRMALVEPGNTDELEAAINEAVRFGVPEEKVAPARTTLMTLTALHLELTALLEPEEDTPPLEPKVLAEAVLSYVNIGVDPTMNSWGNMINSARLELARDPMVWWSLTAAFVFMFALVLAANLFADVVRDAFDPRLRGVR